MLYVCVIVPETPFLWAHVSELCFLMTRYFSFTSYLFFISFYLGDKTANLLRSLLTVTNKGKRVTFEPRKAACGVGVMDCSARLANLQSVWLEEERHGETPFVFRVKADVDSGEWRIFQDLYYTWHRGA